MMLRSDLFYLIIFFRYSLLLIYISIILFNSKNNILINLFYYWGKKLKRICIDGKGHDFCIIQKMEKDIMHVCAKCGKKSFHSFC